MSKKLTLCSALLVIAAAAPAMAQNVVLSNGTLFIACRAGVNENVTIAPGSSLDNSGEPSNFVVMKSNGSTQLRFAVADVDAIAFIGNLRNAGNNEFTMTTNRYGDSLITTNPDLLVVIRCGSGNDKIDTGITGSNANISVIAGSGADEYHVYYRRIGSRIMFLNPRLPDFNSSEGDEFRFHQVGLLR